MQSKFFTFLMVFVALVLISGCSKPSTETENEAPSMIDPVDHVQQELQVLNNARSNINNAVTMKNESLTQALNDSGLTNSTPVAVEAAILHTNKGDITLELYSDAMPVTVGNFVKLARSGFYDGIRFHRVMDGFMIQAGDPQTKDVSLKDRWGTGGPGYTIEDEFAEDLSNARGTISMANTGQPNSGGSQWFINLVDNTNLDHDKPPFTSKHPVFGAVTEGMDVVDAIAKTETDDSDQPIEDVIIEKITLIDE